VVAGDPDVTGVGGSYSTSTVEPTSSDRVSMSARISLLPTR
jgi:hypothetical protein